MNSTDERISKKRFPCVICKKTFYSKFTLERHMQVYANRVHPTPFKCDHCSLEFPEKWKMIAHIKKNHDLKPYHCDKCDEKFEYHRELKDHKLIMHKENLCTR